MAGQCEDCEEKQKLARKTVDNQATSSTAPPIVHDVLANSGQSLGKDVRSQMESSFGHDFSQIRVHTDARAAESAGSVKARAYTVGNHIVFASGQYQPETHTGQRLIAHELAHTIQQGNANPTPQANLEIGEADNEAEREADRLADRALEETGSVESPTRGESALLQRDADDGGPETQPPEPVKPESEEKPTEPVKAEGGEEAPPTAPGEEGAPAAPCDPKGLSRADYLKEPGTSTDDFGLTRLAGSAQIPVVKTTKTAKGLVLEFTDAKMPPLTSVFTAAGKFIEGEVHFIGNPGDECSSKKYPLQWTIFPDGAKKIREAELEHCADFQHAFDISIRRYADVVNDLANKKKVFSSQKAAEKYVTALVGPKPDTWSDVFKCLANKSLLRDDPMKWHTPRPVKRPPKLDDDCKFARALIWGANLPEVGKHSTPDLIKDCGEGPPAPKGGGTGTSTKSAPAPKAEGKISANQTASSVILARLVNPASAEQGPTEEVTPTTSEEATPTTQEEATPATSEQATPESASGLIVEDETARLSPGQMRRTDFLAELRQAVCAAADAELVRVGRNTNSCPYIARAFERYRTLSGSALERRLRLYAPETAGAGTAREYISAVSERISKAVGVWARTGEITGVPDELAGELGGMGIGGLLAGIGGVVGGLLGGLGSMFSALGGMFFKGRAGGVRLGQVDEANLQTQAWSGQMLDSDVRRPMERAFGHDFSRVRVHTDARATTLTSGLNARAVTVGENIAFAHGEYQPGTLVGDALIAHELAHVVQQSGGTSTQQYADQTVHDEDSTLELNADRAAVSAVASVRFGSKAVMSLAHNSLQRLRSGLRLQRCPESQQRPTLPTREVKIGQPESNRCDAKERLSMERINLCCTPNMIGEIQGLLGQAIPIVENARNRLNTPSDVADQLWNNFRVRPDDEARITRIRLILDGMTNSMESNRVKYICSDVSDSPCAGIRAGTTPTCVPTGDVHIRFCGSYPSSDKVISRFLQGDNWVKTMIHEHAHAGCPGNNLIFPAKDEFYKDRGKYPQEPDRNIKNADCYAWFAMDSR